MSKWCWVIPCQLDQWPSGPRSEFDEIFTICLYHWEMKLLKIWAFLMKGVLRYGLLKFSPISALVWFLSFGPFLRACNSVGSKDGMNLKFSVLDNLTKDWQKTYIGKIYSWLPYWLSKIKKKHLFSDFCYILAPKYQTNCQIILNTYSFYTNTTIMEQIKPSIVNIYFKQLHTTHRSLACYFKNG